MNSLRNRLLLVTALVLVVLLCTIGFAVEHSFRNAQIQSLKDRLQVQSYSLLAEAELLGSQIQLPRYLPDSRFNQLEGDLYALLVDQQQDVVWRSISAKRLPSIIGAYAPAGEWRYSRAMYQGSPMFIARLGVEWNDKRYNIVLIESLKGVHNNISEFRQSIASILFVTALFLLFIQIGILRWGFLPLRKLSNELEELHRGHQDRLLNNYPTELQEVTGNLNHLLNLERGQRERYRNTLTDLSHSLKTPLSIIAGFIRNEDLSSSDRKEINQLVDKMSNTIRYQLERSVAGSQGLSHSQVAVLPLIDSILSAMKKVYADKSLRLTSSISDKCQFLGDENDLMEVLANIIDNACKYSHHHVDISARSNAEGLVIQVQDDGPGVPNDHQQQILKRGVRLDMTENGQGMGLALVKEILDAYSAKLEISRSGLGGACFQISFSG